ncbi:hypothetical protein CR513_43136, partial [Mucuna pruriens]
MASCSPDEWAYQFAQSDEVDFIYMYETIIYDLGVTLPFDDFVVGAFRVVCQALAICPLAIVFLNFYSVQLSKKVGSVSLTPLPKRSLFTPFVASYKGFKNRFVRITSVGLSQLHLGQERHLGQAQSPTEEQPNKKQPIASSTSAIQHRGHLSSSSAATSFLEKLGAQVTQGLGTERLKVARRDRLDDQRTLVDLILSVLASGGEPSPSTMAIVMEDGVIESRPYNTTKNDLISGSPFTSDSKPFPLYWKYLSQFKSIKHNSLSPIEQVHLGWLEEFPKGMNCKRLVVMIFESRPDNCLIDFLDQHSIGICSLLQRARREKSSSRLQSGDVGQAIIETSSSPANLGKRKQVGSEEGSRKKSKVPISPPSSADLLTPSTVPDVSEDRVDTSTHLAPTSVSPILDFSPLASPTTISLPMSSGPALLISPEFQPLPSSSTPNLAAFYATPDTSSFWSPDFNPWEGMPSHWTTPHDRQLLQSHSFLNVIDMMASYHFRSLDAIKFWRDIVRSENFGSLDDLLERHEALKTKVSALKIALEHSKTESASNKSTIAELRAESIFQGKDGVELDVCKIVASELELNHAKLKQDLNILAEDLDVAKGQLKSLEESKQADQTKISELESIHQADQDEITRLAEVH